MPGQRLRDPSRPGRAVPPHLPRRHRRRDRDPRPPDARTLPRPARRSADSGPPRSGRLSSRSRPGATSTATRNEPIRIAEPRSCSAAIRSPTVSTVPFMADGGYANRDWWSDDGLGLAATGGRHASRATGRTAAGTPPTSRWSASPSGRRDACCRWAGGRLPTRAGVGGRRPRPRRVTSTPGAASGRTGSATASRPVSGSPPRSGSSPGRRRPSLAWRTWPATAGSGATTSMTRTSGKAGRRACCAAVPSATRPGTCAPRSGSGSEPEDRNWDIGFRCVLASPRQP